MRINRGAGAIALLGSGLLVAAAAVLLLSAGGRAAAATTTVSVQDNQFNMATVTIAAGDTVQWNWTGANPHSVTADGGSFDDPAGSSKVAGTFSRTFNAAGTFAYYCRIHGAPGGVGMSGTITVQAAAAPTNTAPAASNTPPTTSASATTTALPTRTVAATVTPVATSIVTPTITSGLAPTAVAGRPSVPPAAGAAAAAQLPRTGTGRAQGRSVRFGWLSLVLAVSGVGTLGFVPVAVRRR